MHIKITTKKLCRTKFQYVSLYLTFRAQFKEHLRRINCTNFSFNTWRKTLYTWNTFTEYTEKYQGKYLTQDGSKAEFIWKQKYNSSKKPKQNTNPTKKTKPKPWQKSELILVEVLHRYSGSCALQKIWPWGFPG